MNEYTYDELITAYFDNEFNVLDSTREIKPTLIHRYRMKRIFSIFEDNKTKSDMREKSRFPFIRKTKLNVKQKVAFAIILIVGLAFLTGFIIKFISESFKGTVCEDNTQLFAVNTENCPVTIEKEYSLSVLPEGYETYKSGSDPFNRKVQYLNSETKQILSFVQIAKRSFDCHINTEKTDLTEINVNGMNGIALEKTDETGAYTILIWDNGDYVLELTGKFTINELMNLAEINEKQGF